MNPFNALHRSLAATSRRGAVPVRRLRITAVAAMTVLATVGGSATFAPAAFASSPIPQEPLVLPTMSGPFGTPLTLTVSGGSGTGRLTVTAGGSGSASGCAVTSTAPLTLEASSAGTCDVEAYKAGDATYQSASIATVFTFTKVPQTPLLLTSTSGPFDTALLLTTSGGSGTGAITYTASDGTATGCDPSLSTPFTLTSLSAGTCIVTATQATDVDYLPVSSDPTTVTFTKAAQAPLSVVTPVVPVLAGSAFALTTFGGSGSGAVSYAAHDGTATDCVVSGSSLTADGEGTCIVTATQAGDPFYDPISSAPATVTFAKSAQLIALKVTSVTGELGTPLALTTSGGMGTGAVTFVATDGTASDCTVSSVAPYTLTASTAGTCTLTATKATDASFLPAESDPTTVTLTAGSKAPAALILTSTSGTYGSGLPLTTTGGSGAGAVRFTATNGTSTGCSVTDTGLFTLTSRSVGTCAVTATKAADATYLEESSPATTVSFGAAALTVIASSSSITRGAAVPAITASYDGFVDGDTASSLTTAPSCSTTATAASPAGRYLATCTGAVGSNYTISYLPGTVAVTAAAGCATAPFPDVPVSSLFCGDITWLSSHKITAGYADGRFHPAVAVNREQMAAFLFRAANPGKTPTACTRAPFPDVPVSSLFCGDITWLSSHKITAGYADGRFHPAVAVNREQMAAFLFRAANPGKTPTACTRAPFPDVPVSSLFCGDITWLSSHKITTGYADGRFHPVTTVARQEMAAFLHRAPRTVSSTL